jgi:hypothetical protein
VKRDPDHDQHDQDGGDNPVNHQAERRPPPRVGDIVAAMLPEILQSMTDEAEHQQPHRPGDGRRGNQYEYGGDAALPSDDRWPPIRHGEADVHSRD